jgi:hypothetical protein
MFCPGCSKLAHLFTKKNCLRCSGAVVVNIAVICEVCSIKDKICAVCLRKIPSLSPRSGGCGCQK